jgi:hypothetical protein
MLLNEQRKGKRKLLKVKAILTMEGAETVLVRTLDVGGDGVCLLTGMSLKPGALGTVRFDIFQDGKATTISARARVQYCILSNGDFKIGCQFVNLELSAMAALSRFLQ